MELSLHRSDLFVAGLPEARVYKAREIPFRAFDNSLTNYQTITTPTLEYSPSSQLTPSNMRFWSNLWDGAKSAGQGALDHAGQIAGVVSTVAKVAKMAALNDSELTAQQSAMIQDENGNLDSYHSKFEYNHKYITKRAKN